MFTVLSPREMREYFLDAYALNELLFSAIKGYLNFQILYNVRYETYSSSIIIQMKSIFTSVLIVCVSLSSSTWDTLQPSTSTS